MSAPHCIIHVCMFLSANLYNILNQNEFDSGIITILVKEHLEKPLNSSVRRIHTVYSLKETVLRNRFQKV